MQARSHFTSFQAKLKIHQNVRYSRLMKCSNRNWFSVHVKRRSFACTFRKQIVSSKQAPVAFEETCPFSTTRVPSLPHVSLTYHTCPFPTTRVPSLPHVSLPYHTCPFPTTRVPSLPHVSLPYHTCPFSTTRVPSLPHVSLTYHTCPFSTTLATTL